MCGMLDVTLEDDPIQPDPIISDPPSVQVPTLNIKVLWGLISLNLGGVQDV